MFLKHARNTLSPSDLYSLVNNHGIIDTTATSNITSTPVIFLAILSLREDILKLLVSHNLPTNLTLSQYPLSDGKSALMVAIQSGTIFMMQLLLKKATSDLNHMDLLKNTPLALACLQPYERLETLLKYDDGLINPNLLNMQGLSPLFICGVSSPTKFSLLFRHFQNRLDISLRDNRGKSIIQHAVELNHLNAFECIVKRARKQAKLSSIIGQEIPNSGGNILHLASHLSWTDNKDMVEYMMENLILATSAHKNRLSHIVNKVDNEGMTPLMRAIYATANPNNEAVIDILINKGRADLKVRNNDGKTAADLAFEKGRINLGEELYCRMHNIKRLEEEEKE